MDIVLYLKCSLDVETHEADVYLKDIATLECEDKKIIDRCKNIKIHRFEEDKTRVVISITKIIRQINKECPGILIQSIGETDILIEKVTVDTYKGWKLWFKVLLVCLVSFFGTAFTLIAYNNDISITKMFAEIYQIFGETEMAGKKLLEISYSVGLTVGIVLFFNHVGGRRITKDPTPIEVSMRNYERDVNQALLETAEREGKEEHG